MYSDTSLKDQEMYSDIHMRQENTKMAVSVTFCVNYIIYVLDIHRKSIGCCCHDVKSHVVSA